MLLLPAAQVCNQTSACAVLLRDLRDAEMLNVGLASETDWEGWRRAVRALVLAGIPPDDVTWHVGVSGDALPQESGKFGVSRSLMELTEVAIQARDPGRFALLHRLVASPEAAKLAEANRLALQVRAEAHRMRTQMRFMNVDGRYVGWFVPRHFVLEANAQLLSRRFSDIPVSILTPAGSAHWHSTPPAFLAGDAMQGWPRDIADDAALAAAWREHGDAWLAAARSGTAIPEADDLPEAPRRPDLPALGPVVLPPAMVPDAAADAATCTLCPLHEPATQTVFGEGPQNARLLFIGEQAGDQEDIVGRPFVGPAGQMLDRALEEAGIDRRQAYVTNAVKHFKFEMRGKRRIHQKPNSAEVAACSVWLADERATLRPSLTVLLGGTAASAVLGRTVTIGRERGRPIEGANGQRLFVTVHPSYLLRIPDAAAKAREYEAFVADLKVAAELVG